MPFSLRSMRTRILLILVALCVAMGALPAAAQREAPRALRTVPGQVKLMTVNARQNAVLGLKRFEDMYELSWAARTRPAAFNGGYGGAVAAPDVIALQEMRTSNVEIFEHLLRQRFKMKYQVAGAEDAASQLIYNPETVTLQGEPVTWDDVCSDNTPGSRDRRFYQFARFTENKSGAPFVVAAMHIPKNFVNSGQAECYTQNIQEMRDQLALETDPTFVMGDFNRRAVEEQHECDPEELSPEFQWHMMMTQPTDGGRAFLDAVRAWHRQRNLSLADQWTHEQKTMSLACNGQNHIRRSRIDYIFSAGAVIAEAGVDDPGWAGDAPGVKSTVNHKYSDHRFVWGRFVISAPPRPLAPELTQEQGGAVAIGWQPVEGAVGYTIYRALPGHAYSALEQVGGTTTSFEDPFTEHGITYRYSIAAIGADDGQSLESRNTKLTVDARGPQIVSRYPSPGATGIDRRANIRIVFDERVSAASVTNDRIRLYRGTKRLTGTVKQVAPRVLIFDPSFPMWKGKLHRVVTKPVKDRYGNLGQATTFYFTTEKPPKKKRGN